MKIVFSRKGTDARAGGFPSPIFPDGTMFSVPIPSSSRHDQYSRLRFNYQEQPIQKILNDITRQRIRNGGAMEGCDYLTGDQGCHHDPMRLRDQGLMVLGQADGAESELRNQGVTVGDLFLFFGWFRKIAEIDGLWTYEPNAPDIQVIWSWMTVANTFMLDNDAARDQVLAAYPDLLEHPHLAADCRAIPNGVYLSADHALMPFSQRRVLTDMQHYRGRSTWRLPRCLNQPQAFTRLKKFVPEANGVVVSYQGFGQEFILDLNLVIPIGEQQRILDYVNDVRAP